MIEIYYLKKSSVIIKMVLDGKFWDKGIGKSLADLANWLYIRLLPEQVIGDRCNIYLRNEQLDELEDGYEIVNKKRHIYSMNG